jgi:hypothetical protein
MADRDKRTRLLILPVAGLGIGYLILLGYLLLGDSLGMKMTAATPPTSTPIDVWDAYEQAQVAAQAEAPDGQLVSASTQWQAVSEDALLNEAGNWTLVFYSQQSGHVLDVVVNGGVGRVVSRTQVWVAPKVVPEGVWQAGPVDVLRAFLACGGRAFLDEHPQAVIDLHLAGDEGGNVIWSVAALEPGGHDVLSLEVDAETGQVLSDLL